MLSRGNFSIDVAAWQAFLRGRGYRNWHGDSLAVTGDFDDDTEYATRCFQRDHGLQQTGAVCPRTEGAAGTVGWRGEPAAVATDHDRRWTS